MKEIIFILTIGILSADYGGGYAGSGYRYGSNAREFSLAGALVADKSAVFFVSSNPSLLRYARLDQIGLSYQAMSLDRSIQNISFIKKLPPTAGMGFALLRAATTNIEGKNEMNEYTETFSSQEIQAILSFGLALSNQLALGINIKMFYQNISSEFESANNIGLDFGFLYKINRSLLLGGIYENINGGYNWKLDHADYEELFPKLVKIGLTYTGIKHITICFQEDMLISPSDYINYRSRLGLEYHFSKGIKLRGGMKYSDKSYNDMNL